MSASTSSGATARARRVARPRPTQRHTRPRRRHRHRRHQDRHPHRRRRRRRPRSRDPRLLRGRPGRRRPAIAACLDEALGAAGLRARRPRGGRRRRPGPRRSAARPRDPRGQPRLERLRPARRARARLGRPVVIENDVRAAAIGLHERGVVGDASDLAYLAVGTGIAAGVVLDGRLHRGARGLAGEIGHAIVDPDGPRCACGQRGCLEAFASGPSIARRADATSATAGLRRGRGRRPGRHRSRSTTSGDDSPGPSTCSS